MADQQSRRSVMPNGRYIDVLRKTKALTILGLAAASDLGMRTVQKAIAGNPVSIETLQIIADTLNAPYESLLLGADAPEVLTLDIRIEIGVADARKINDIIEFLRRLLPDYHSLCMIAVTSGSVLIGVTHSQANETVIAGLEFQEAMNTLGIESWSRSRNREPAMFGFLDSVDAVNYLSYARSTHDANENERPQTELRTAEEYAFYCKYLNLIAGKEWSAFKDDFQALLDEIKIVLHPNNFDSLHLWCDHYLHNRLDIDYPDSSVADYTNRYRLLVSFIRHLKYLDVSYKYTLLRDQR